VVQEHIHPPSRGLSVAIARAHAMHSDAHQPVKHAGTRPTAGTIEAKPRRGGKIASVPGQAGSGNLGNESIGVIAHCKRIR